MTIPKLYNLPVTDPITGMSIAEGDNMPFAIKRVYWMTSNEQDQIRGEHAHKSCQQLLVCLSGKLNITLEDLNGKKYTFDLSQPNLMLWVPAQYWSKIEYKKGAVILVLASAEYDEQDYIRDYSVFKAQSDQ